MKKEKKKPYTSTWSNICWSVKGQFKYARTALLVQVLFIPLNVGLAWAGIYLPSLVVAEVSGGRGLAHAAFTVGIWMFAILCANLLWNVLDYYVHTIDQIYTCKVRDILYEKAMGLFYQTYEKKKTRDLFWRAEMTTQMWNGEEPVKDMTWHTRKFLESVICYALFGTVLSFVSPWLLVLLTLAPAANWFFVRAYQKWVYENKEKWGELDRKLWYVQGKTAEFSAAKDIRIYGMAGWMRQMYGLLCEERSGWDRKRIWKNYFSRIVDIVVILLRDGAAYAVLILMVRKGEITADQFVLYFAAISSFATWIGNILSEWNRMRGTSLALCDLREYLEYPDRNGGRNQDKGKAREEGTGIFDFSGGAPDIIFDHVSFRYDGAEEDTLHDICLTLHGGERLALVGMNGAGKTTLVKLLCGLYEPTAGEIRILTRGSSGEAGFYDTDATAAGSRDFCGGREGTDSAAYNSRGIPACRISRVEYYKLFSVVFQKVNQMFFSLAETVSGCGENACDLVRVKECIERAGLSEKLASLPDGIHTKLDKQVNEGGIELSGGELQKLMLARALYKDAPVLVLDEPTAALDPVAESRIYEEYKNMTKGKSSLFISHRLASTRFCDRILYLQGGRITEEGTHDSLLAAGGGYAKLYEIQSCWYQEEGGHKTE